MNNNRPLQSKDLMLGDWVLWGYTTASGVKVGGYKMQVAAIYQDDLVDLIDNDSLYEQVPMDEVEAIPLTAEILEKNGWLYQEYPDDEKFIWPVDNEIEMPFRLLVGMDGNRYWVTVGICGLMCPINYVHELQHALRLAGVGKEIEL